ncbi:acyltransferase family protein [Enterococcus massiliensis]|uniref:acyltransferase family protein n=1 Tax=Enterococcus massiliensis TaxID=1640685 RepID=UPI00065DBEAA|nr:acyltransferase family protein [Enterococcus massiliensis]
MKHYERMGSFDVLKIGAIFFIILHHYALWTGWNFEKGIHFNKIIAQSLLVGGKLGVNIFIMITGYFMIKSSPKIKSLIIVWMETTVISLFIYFLTLLFQLEGQVFSMEVFIRRLFPVVFGQYWFVTAYSLMYLVIPIINKIMLDYNDKKRVRILSITFVLLSIYTFIYYDKGMTFSFPIWFVFLYSLGAHIRLNENNFLNITFKKLFVNVIVIFSSLVLINISLQYLFSNKEYMLTKILTFLGWHETIFYTRDASPLLLLLAVNIFIIAMKIKIKPRKAYQYISRAAFGVYLLQSAPWFSTEYLWPILVNGQRFLSGKYILIYGVLVTTAIYIVGIVIYTFLTPIVRGSVKICNRIIKKLENFIYE